MGGTGGRRPAVGLAFANAVSAGLAPLVASLALEIAPVRVNLIAAGFADTPLSATLPIGRVVEPATSPRSPCT